MNIRLPKEIISRLYQLHPITNTTHITDFPTFKKQVKALIKKCLFVTLVKPYTDKNPATLLICQNNIHISFNMRKNVIIAKLKALGLNEKKIISFLKELNRRKIGLYFKIDDNDDLLLLHEGKQVQFLNEDIDAPHIALIFPYSDWVDITKEIHPTFDELPIRLRHRLILNTIRHNTFTYDSVSNDGLNGPIARLFGEKVIEKYPSLRNAVLEFWDEKEKSGKQVDNSDINLDQIAPSLALIVEIDKKIKANNEI